MTLTRIFIFAVVFISVVYDIGIFFFSGVNSTISVQLYTLSKTYPAIPFGFGLLMGHLFLPVRAE